ncbi:MAG: hypothetical protein PHS62_03205 [Patescibacteria group bacterium]|nr:hypothetical protein [Patescibacteria group bacterium]
MTKIILIVIFSVLVSSPASASEIFGQISTNPSAPTGGTPPVVVPPAGGAAPAAARGGGAAMPAPANQPAEPAKNQPAAENSAPESNKPSVLGVKIYPDGSLIRGADQKIYLVQGRIKKYLASLEELARYRGRPILKAAAAELASLETRDHADGELIRQIGDAKVYVIKSGGKQHILNLAELRAHYFGQEIFNISGEEMEKY